MDHPIKPFIDYVVGPMLIGLNLVFQLLPAMAFIIPVVYYSIQIYESKTFQNYRQRARTRRAARIEAKILALKAKLVERELFTKSKP